MRIYFDRRDLYVGVFIGEHYYFVVFFTLVIRIPKRSTRNARKVAP